jgi:hypothetical protein
VIYKRSRSEVVLGGEEFDGRQVFETDQHIVRVVLGVLQIQEGVVTALRLALQQLVAARHRLSQFLLEVGMAVL